MVLGAPTVTFIPWTLGASLLGAPPPLSLHREPFCIPQVGVGLGGGGSLPGGCTHFPGIRPVTLKPTRPPPSPLGEHPEAPSFGRRPGRAPETQ